MTFALKAIRNQSQSESCRKFHDSTESLFGMFSEPSERHHAPHFHAYYSENIAVFTISPVALLTGSMPQRQQRLIEAWAELHQDELRADWELLRNGKRPAPVDPLR
jgi:hypothetical protein